MAPMTLVAGYSVIEKQLGVAQQFRLDGAAVQPATALANLVYVIPPSTHALRAVCDRLRTATTQTIRHHIAFVPNESIVCETFMAETNVMTQFKSGGCLLLQAHLQ